MGISSKGVLGEVVSRFVISVNTVREYHREIESQERYKGSCEVQFKLKHRNRRLLRDLKGCIFDQYHELLKKQTNILNFRMLFLCEASRLPFVKDD